MQKEHSDIQFQVGKSYSFIVRTIHDDFCEVLDESGFQVYLQHTANLNLVKNQKIQCLVTAYNRKRPRIELVDAEQYAKDKTKLNTQTVGDIIESIATDWDTEPFIQLLTVSEVEDTSFETECREWIRSLKDDGKDLEAIMRDCTAFMEESDFFSLCNSLERDYYLQRLTLLIELLGYYIKAAQLTAEGSETEFLNGILDKLEKTGYVYHPQENFNVMSCLLLNNSSLIEGSINRLFNIIRKWPLDFWVKEPFKSTLIKVINLYVEDNIWKVDKQDDNDNLVTSLIQGISILLLLADNTDNKDSSLPDERLSLARLCVLSTYKQEYNNKEVLTLAMNSLMGRQYYRPAFSLADTEGGGITFKLKTHPAHSQPWPIDTTNSYISGKHRLVLSPEGISIYSGDAKEKPVIPDSIGLWQNLQVFVDKRTVTSLTGKIKISDCKRLWEDIELDLFQQKQAKAVKKIHFDDTGLTVGKHVTITITRIDDKDRSRAYCSIKGKGECGYINAADTVSYMRELFLWMFQDDITNKPYQLEAVVEEDLGNDQYRFSMLEPIKDFVSNNAKPGETIVCSVGKARGAGESTSLIPAITAYGESVSLGGYSDVPLKLGDLVEATYQNTGTGTFHLYCTINRRIDGIKVNTAQAFHKLMQEYRYADEAEDTADPKDGNDNDMETEESSDAFEQNDRMLDAAYIKEVIRIIDRMAFTEPDYVRSYNYLAFARVVCRLIGWDHQADYYRGRLQLIFLLYDFAINDRVDTAGLNMLQNSGPDLFHFDTAMTDKFQQLRIVSYMNTTDNDNELWRYRCSTDQVADTTKKVASLALAYNILLENHMTTQANDVLNRVKDTLSLKGYESNLDIYGQGIETKTVEYKTSIVFPPNNHMKADMRQQMGNILAVIASFLNTDGGTLYIGCNNSGAGVGLDNDLDYREFNGDLDKYLLTISNAVSINFGNMAKSHVNAYWKKGEKSGKEIVVVEVEPYEEGVSLNGVWFYRDDNGKRRLLKADFEKYNERRLLRRKIELANAKVAVSNMQAEEPETSTVAQKTPSNAPAALADPAAPKVGAIKTSCIRKNVLAEDGSGYYRPFEACLKFLDKGKFCKITDYDYDDSTLLTLAVYDEETQDGMLILGYEDGSVTKVQVRELLRFDDYNEYNRNTSSPLVFATIAFDGDGLVVASKDNSDRIMVRVDTIANIEPGRLADKGQKLYNDGIAKELVQFEILPADELEPVSTINNMGPKSIGKSLTALSAKTKKTLSKVLSL